MKNIAILLSFVFSISMNAQIVVTPGGTAMALAQAIVGPGITVSNAVLNCGSVSFGLFSNGNTGTGNIGIAKGVLLTTGQASDVANSESVQASYDSNIPSYIGSNAADPNLVLIDTNVTINTCKLEFDLVPICPNMKINYVFASEEYPDYVCSAYNDAFGFFISGPGITGVQNIAKIPATNIAVAINAINSGTPGIAGTANGCTSLAYSSLFNDNSAGPQIVYEGFTIPLVASATITPCQTYHLKIVIADANDDVYDSGVFLQQDGITCVNTLVINPSPVTLCAGQSATLTANGSINGSNNYTWTPNTGISTNTGSLVIVNPTVSTTYTVSTPSICNQILTQTISVTVIPCVTSITAQGGTICAGSCFSITTSTSGNFPPYTYLWDGGATTSSLNACPLTTTIYTVTVTDANNSVASNTVMVTVNAKPVVSIPSASICSGVCTTLTATGAINYTWSPATGLNSISGTSVVACPSVTTTYSVIGTTTAGCVGDTMVGVVVNSAPVSDAGANLILCSGTTGTIGSIPVAGYTYTWSPSTGLSNSTISNPTDNLINTGALPIITIYTVTTTETSSGCVSKDTVLVTITSIATANAGSNQTGCIGATFTLSGSVGGSATSGTWSGGAGSFSPSASILNAVYIPTAAEYASGSVTLTLTSNDPIGPCSFASSNVVLHFQYQTPIVDFTVDDSVGCQTHCVNFKNLTHIGGGDSIFGTTWNFGDGINNTQTLAHCYPKSGSYAVSLTAISNHGCSASKIKPGYITVFPNPVAAFDPTPKPATIMDPLITLNNQSSSDVIIWHYWFGDGDTISYAPPNNYNPNPTHLYSDDIEQTYFAKLIVESSFGCIDTVKHEIIIGPMFTFYIPNTFTPNGDSINDVFFGKGMGIVTYEILIFDRWGTQVFQGNSIDAVWDGKSKGGVEFAKQDVYTWQVKLTDVLKKQHNYVGHVLLLR